MELDEETAVLASGTVWQNIGSIAVKLVSFIYTIIIARMVSQEEIGLFYFGLSIVGLIGIVADFGISQTVQRYVPYYLGKNERTAASRVVCITIVLGTALLVAAALLAFFLAPAAGQFFGNPALVPILTLLAVYLCVNQTFTITQSILASLKQMKQRSISSNLQNVLKIALTLAFIAVLGPNARALTLAFILSFIIGTAYLLMALYRSLKELDLPAPSGTGWYGPYLREMLPFGLTMVSISMFGALITYTDRVMLGYLLQSNVNAQIAIYTLATSLATIVALLAGSITVILLPVASGLVSKSSTDKITKATQTSLRWILFSSVPFAVFFAAFAAPSLRVLYGANYEPGALSLALFSIGMLFYLMGSVQSTLIAAHRLVKLELIAFICGAVVNVVLNALLIPQFGINGSSFAGMVSLMVVAGINHIYAARRFNFSIPLSIWKNLFAGAIVLVLLIGLEQVSYNWLVNLPIPVSSLSVLGGVADKIVKLAILSIFFAIGSLAYLILLNLMHLFEHEDRHVFERLLAKTGLPAGWRARISKMVFWHLPREA